MELPQPLAAGGLVQASPPRLEMEGPQAVMAMNRAENLPQQAVVEEDKDDADQKPVPDATERLEV